MCMGCCLPRAGVYPTKGVTNIYTYGAIGYGKGMLYILEPVILSELMECLWTACNVSVLCSVSIETTTNHTEVTCDQMHYGHMVSPQEAPVSADIL